MACPGYDHGLYPSHGPGMYPGYDHGVYPSHGPGSILVMNGVYPSQGPGMYPGFDNGVYPSRGSSGVQPSQVPEMYHSEYQYLPPPGPFPTGAP